MNNQHNIRYLVAYGSNLNIAELKRKWHVNLGKPVARVFLPDRRLAFTSYSKSRRGGVLDVPPARGSCVESLIFACPDEAFAIICKKEGSRYVERQGWAFSLEGERYWVTYFEVRPEYREEFVAPSAYYLSLVRWGYQHFGLSADALECAARGEAATSAQLPLFTYGTLMRGQSRHGILAPFISQAGVPCEAWGRLKTTGSYPILIDHMRSRSLVPGEGYRIDDPEAAFLALDRVEGARSYTETTPGYYRTPIVVATSDRGWERIVWCYVWWGEAPARSKLVRGNAWVNPTLAGLLKGQGAWGDIVH